MFYDNHADKILQESFIHQILNLELGFKKKKVFVSFGTIAFITMCLCIYVKDG